MPASLSRSVRRRGGGRISKRTPDALDNAHRSTKDLLVAVGIGFGAAIALEIVGGWLWMLLAGAIVGALVRGGKRVFILGGAAVAGAWAALLGYQAVRGPVFALASLLASIIGLGAALAPLIVILTLAIGFLLGGFGAFHGAFIVRALR